MEENKKDSTPAVEAEKTENLSKEDLKAIERENTRKEKQEYIERRRIKRGRKTLRARKLKNFLFFITGFFASLIILFGGIFIGAKFVPIKTYFGEGTGEYVDEEKIGNKSVIDAAMSIGEYAMSDIPFVYDKITSLFTDSGINKIITLDKEKFGSVKFDGSFGDGLLSSVKVSKELFGSLGELDLFNTTAVPADKVPTEESDFEPRLYYYLKETDGIATYERAFDDAKARVAPDGETIYYLSLSEMSVSDMTDLFTARFKLLTVKSLLEKVGGITEDSLISEIIGDRTINEMGSFDADDIYLKTFLDVPTEENGYSNQMIYDVLRDAIAYADDGTTVSYDDTINYGDIKLGDLAGDHFNIDYVRLNKIIKIDTIGENAVLNLLLADDTVRFGNLATKINEMRIKDLYEIECFTQDSSKANDITARYSYEEATGVYTFNPAGDWYIDKEAGIWIFVLFTAGSANSDGYAETYTDKDLKFQNLRGNVGSLSDNFTAATVRQLYVAGIINTEYDNIMSLTVNQVLEDLNTASAMVP